MVKHLKTLEHGKKSNDPSDLLDEPYSGAAYGLSQAEDDWQAQLVRLDTVARRTQAPSPGSIGSKRPHVTLAASKASWIFSADAACASGSHALYQLKEPSQTASLGTFAKYEDRYATIITKVNTDLRKITLPRADQSYLRRTVYKSLKANDTLASSARTMARALRGRSLALLNQSDAQAHVASKGISALSHQMTSYGAEYCGWFFNPHTKSSSSKSSGGGSISA
jgi:hypothetical protein